MQMEVDRAKENGTLKTMDELASGTPHGWSASHEEEKKFQTKKLRKLKLTAFTDGHLLEEELDRRIQKDALAALAKRRTTARKRKAEKALTVRKLQARAPLGDTFWDGKKVFFNPDVLAPVLRKTIENAFMTHVDERTLADVIVAKDPANPGRRSQLAAALTGAFLTTPAFLKNLKPNPNSVLLKYLPAISIHKEIWMSAHFKTNHSELSKLIDAVLLPARVNSKWKRLATHADYTRRFKTASASHRGKNIVALVGKTENKDRPPACFRV